MSKKHLLLVACLLLLRLPMMVSAQEANQLIIGHKGDQWFAGYGLTQTARRSIGFFGYEQHSLSTQVTVGMESQDLLGRLSLTRDVYVGNLRYNLTGFAGRAAYPDAYGLRLDKEWQLGVSGDYQRRQGRLGKGVTAKVILWQDMSVAAERYWQSFGVTTHRVALGYDSRQSVYGSLSFRHNMPNQAQFQIHTRLHPMTSHVEYGAGWVSPRQDVNLFVNNQDSRWHAGLDVGDLDSTWRWGTRYHGDHVQGYFMYQW